MIDLHCHILPGLDDGAADLEASLLMAKKAEEEGIHTIIATPHHKNEKYVNPKESVLEEAAKLNDYLKEQRVDIEILAGQEVRVFGEIMEEYESGDILTLADRTPFILIEFPSGHVPRYAEKLLYDLQLKGLMPIIVHPERNQELMENPDLLYKLVKNGAFTQVTAGSVAGKFGKKIQRFSAQLIAANLTHFVASDAHNNTTRGFYMAEAYSRIKKQFGTDVEYLFQENPYLLFEGKSVLKEMPERVGKKKFLGIF
ncbi:tyrosine-protein phosphatase [Falsibacillus pallidus]|uniref:Tyrosine-protein phosphatase n=1 Tax=Falsibacillus pallidus TaxID=493781 RepID=A0A370GD74_9BACI|nr:CpsB/CapC family capsule biosynthesis tyrosine phosphatase [Falsibacillus pallidus]RDI41647.1 protein-tyrosine phosphatase [Falsibacillus pallidus]